MDFLAFATARGWTLSSLDCLDQRSPVNLLARAAPSCAGTSPQTGVASDDLRPATASRNLRPSRESAGSESFETTYALSEIVANSTGRRLEGPAAGRFGLGPSFTQRGSDR
jgi:hypothetical protein